MGLVESVWPRACYMMRLIDEHNPPTPLSGPSRPAGENPYSDFDMSQRWIAHCLVAIRSVSLVTLIPFSDTLFYRLSSFRSHPVLTCTLLPVIIILFRQTLLRIIIVPLNTSSQATSPLSTRPLPFSISPYVPCATHFNFVLCRAGCTCTSG